MKVESEGEAEGGDKVQVKINDETRTEPDIRTRARNRTSENEQSKWSANFACCHSS